MQYITRSALLLWFLLGLAGCSGGNAAQIPSGAAPRFAGPGQLPDLPRAASAATSFDGVDFTATGQGITAAPPVIVIDATWLDCSWAMYTYGVPVETQLDNLLIDVEAVTGEYWVGLSDYGVTDSWEFHGPYSDDAAISLESFPGKYTSDMDNFHWVVVTARDNVVTLVSSTIDYTPLTMPLFHVPPSGMQTVAPGPVVNPSLAIMHSAPGSAEDGAPVIFYTAGDGESANTYMAFYNGAAWESQLLDDTQRLTHTHAHWTGSEGVIICYYHGDSTPMDPSRFWLYYTGAEWRLDTAEKVAIGTLYDRIPVMMAMDHDDVRRRTAYICAYTEDTMPATVQVNMASESGGSQSGDLSIIGDTFGGVDIAFSPGPVDDSAWAMYSSGTVDTSESILLDFQIKYAQLEDMSWSWEVSNYIDHNEPLALDLHYNAAGQPELLMVAARDLTIPLVGITATLYYDVALGSYNGSTWSFADLFESDIAIKIFQSEMDVDLGIDVSWAAPDALFYANVDGTVEYATSPEFAVTGGDLYNHANYMTDSGSGYGSSAYFTGDPGLTHSWAAGPDGAACAYLNVDQVDVEGLLAGNIGDTSADLVYWSP